jgi:exodeoxyribonuclease-3
VCLQELKAPAAEFSEGPLRKAGSVAQKTWSGIAIHARKSEYRRDPPAAAGRQGCTDPLREADINGAIVAFVYAPNSNPQPGPKFDYKLAGLQPLNAHAATLLSPGARAVIAGDFSVVPTPGDIYPKSRARTRCAAGGRGGVRGAA